ncbi:MAG: molybdopterin-dependent oxidoreductase, partial [Pseudomonadota bacterium]
PDAVAFYVSGQLLTEDYYVANKLMKGFIGSANIDTNSRLCMASSVAGHKRAFGEDVVPGVYEDLELAELVVLVGSNLAWCHPVLHQRLIAARDQKQTKIVVIDPRATATTNCADLHLALAPGSDVALFNGLLKYLIADGCLDEAYIAEHCDGYEKIAEIASEFTIGRVSKITGLESAAILQFYEWFSKYQQTVTVYSQGVNQSSAGTDKVNAIINAHLVTGRIAKPGSVPFSVTGQPNAMGGRETGGLANMLASHIDFGDELGYSAVREFWQAPNLAKQPGLKAVDLFEQVAAGKIKALWIMATNPAVSICASDKVRRAIELCDFVVVSEVVKRTESTTNAKVLLPAAAWAEKDGTVTNSERCISRQRGFVPAPGEAKPDWWIICEVAKRMGFHQAFSFSSSAAIFREYAAMTRISSENRRLLNLSSLENVTDVAYDALQPFRWPCAQTPLFGKDDGRLFVDGQFSTASGRAKLVETPFRPPKSSLETEYPFYLNSGRIRDQWHTMTRSICAPQLGEHIGEPFVEIHPQDAQTHQIQPADLVRINNENGAVVVRALVTDRVKLGELFVPMHWSNVYASDAKVNSLFGQHVDPVSGQPELKFAAVKAEKFAVDWYAFAVTAAEPCLDAIPYWAKMRCKDGWRIEMAGFKSIADTEKLATRVCGVSQVSNVASYFDSATGNSRLAFSVGGTVSAAFFAAREPVICNRTATAKLLGADMNDRNTAILFSGIEPGAESDDGTTICSCMSIGRAKIERAIRRGATTTAEVGEVTLAGTNCGSCRMEIQYLINANSLAKAV